MAVSPAWSFDGRKIAFTLIGSRSHYLGVWSGGGKPKVYTLPSTNVVSPRFLPSGQIAVSIILHGKQDIYLLDGNQQPSRVLASSRGISVSPSFDSSGRVMAIKRRFREERVDITDEFLAAKLPAFSGLFPDVRDPVARFQKLNTELRRQNAATLVDLASRSAPEPLWDGAFIYLPRSVVRGSFGADRIYTYNGREIDHDRSIGIDLASVASAPVPAANNGVVVLAGPLGVYGRTVVIDHEDAVVEVVTLRLRARGRTDKPEFTPCEHLRADVPAAARLGARPLTWRGRELSAQWYDRERLVPGNRFDGPALVAEPSATTFVPPQAAATVDAYGNLVLDPGAE